MQRITIIAGIGFTREGTSIPDEVLQTSLTLIREMLTDTFGGFTENTGIGGWKNGSSYVQEASKTWTMFVKNWMTPAEVWNVARDIARTLRQESVLAVFEGDTAREMAYITQ